MAKARRASWKRRVAGASPAGSVKTRASLIERAAAFAPSAPASAVSTVSTRIPCSAASHSAIAASLGARAARIFFASAVGRLFKLGEEAPPVDE